MIPKYGGLISTERFSRGKQKKQHLTYIIKVAKVSWSDGIFTELFLFGILKLSRSDALKHQQPVITWSIPRQ